MALSFDFDEFDDEEGEEEDDDDGDDDGDDKVSGNKSSDQEYAQPVIGATFSITLPRLNVLNVLLVNVLSLSRTFSLIALMCMTNSLSLPQ